MSNKKSFLIALLANVVNSYDYALFGLTAAKLAKEFFSSQQEVDAIFHYFIIYSATLIIRPVASLIFGIIGDKYGRAEVLRLGAIGIALPVFIIAFIPSYQLIGSSSSVLFILCRLTILTFLAGEADGIRIYIYEKISDKYKFFGSGLVTACSQGGSLIAALAAWCSTLDFMPDYAWRINFFIGAIFGFLIIYLRQYFEETEEFLQHSRKNLPSSSSIADSINLPVRNILKEHFNSIKVAISENSTAFIRSILIQGAIGGIYHFHIIFYSLYTINILKLGSAKHIEMIRLITILSYMTAALFSGLLHDFFKPRLIASAALILSIILSCININNVAQNNYVAWPIILIGFLTPIHTTAMFIFLKRQFSTGVKYRLFGFTHSLGAVLISSTTPLIAMKIWKISHITWLPIIYLIILMSSLLWQFNSKKFLISINQL